MGVTYKLKDEVVHFIISQRQGNPLASCRQLAESVSQKFGLRLSKSSVHDVLKESGIMTPRGRKPKDKFEIPQEKKKQIQVSLSQIKLLPDPIEIVPPAALPDPPAIPIKVKDTKEISPEYAEAGRIFLKAALWDLGIFQEENVKDAEWSYYLTYSKGIRVVLENDKSFLIDLPLPLERCIRETADGLINNVRPLILGEVSDQELFKACMAAQTGFKMVNILIVDGNDHILFELRDIVERNRSFMISNRIFVENKEKDMVERSKTIFFPQVVDNNVFIENILNLKGFDSIKNDENTVTLLIQDGYANKAMLEQAAEKLNSMYIYDDQDRLVKVRIQ